MMLLFKRHYRLQVHDKIFTDLNINFSVSRDLSKAPNKASVYVFNLAEQTSDLITTYKNKTLILRCGYYDQDGKIVSDDIYRGEIKEVFVERDGTSIVTRIECSDGARAYHARVSETLPKGTTSTQVIQRLAKSMGLDLSNFNANQAVKFFNNVTQFSNGTTLQGKASKELDNIISGLGKTWSIQNNSLQILGDGQTVSNQSLVIKSGTGLVGNPVEKEGGINFTTLIIPGLYPGVLVKLESRKTNQFVKVLRCDYVGEYRGGQWYINCEGAFLE